MAAKPTQPGQGGVVLEADKVAEVDAVVDDEDDELEIEVSPNGRWKRMHQEYMFKSDENTERNLAYDNEKGIMAVWNQTLLSKKRWDMWHAQVKQSAEGAVLKLRMNELKTKVEKEFKTLLEIKHVNIVAFLDYWTDGNWEIRPGDEQGRRAGGAAPRIVWIAEQMTAGTLKKHIKKVKGNNVKLAPKIWKRWCKQILSALRYLHSNNLPHGNIQTSSIHVQHKGAIKIGSRNMRILDENVKTMKVVEAGDWVYVAPEILQEGGGEEDAVVDGADAAPASESASAGDPASATPQAADAVNVLQKLNRREHELEVECRGDIYAFGIVALEMITLSTPYAEYPKFAGLVAAKNDNVMPKTLDAIAASDLLRHDFIKACLRPYRTRPSAKTLMLREVLHTVPPLQHFATHRLVDYLKEKEERRAKRAKRRGGADNHHFDSHEWLTAQLLEPYHKWTEGCPMSHKLNGEITEMSFPEKIVDIETLIDEVGKGLHEMYNVKKGAPSAKGPSPKAVGAAAAAAADPVGGRLPGCEVDETSRESDVDSPEGDGEIVSEAGVDDDEKSPPMDKVPSTPEQRRVTNDQTQVVIVSSEDDDMMYDVSVTLHLKQIPSSEKGRHDPPGPASFTRRLVQFGYPHNLKDTQMIVEQLTRCCLLHPDDAELVKAQIDSAIADHGAQSAKGN
mmetsp:Transcript_7299/g.21571  ORF Transcript_7299/g.21571 Transcript_7299/m.21571 type:complete len:677 (-) Transcript_7299:1246-3276(-)